jgi:diaminopimelate decarboxylase
VRFRGVHVFAASQLLDGAAIAANLEEGWRIARRAARLHGAPLECVNLGGGFGVAYHEGQREPNLKLVRRALFRIAGEARRDPAFRRTRFFLESGRFLASACGEYVARVVERKRSRGHVFLVLDGGMNHHLAASGNLGAVLRRDYPVRVIGRGGPREPVTVTGPLCTPLDILAAEARLPRSTCAGDLVAIGHSGAYALTASPVGFLSRPLPRQTLR